MKSLSFYFSQPVKKIIIEPLDFKNANFVIVMIGVCKIIGVLSISFFILKNDCQARSVQVSIVTDTIKKHANQKPEFKSLLPKNTSIETKNSDKVQAKLNPQVEGFKDDYVKKEKHEMSRMKEWGRPYFHIYDRVLSQYGLPLELKYLSVIESSLQSGMRSWAGAVGPWQLMDDEAHRFGLKVNEGVDERMDYEKSTVAAAKLLTELYRRFGDWLLVIAAYNAGPGAVHRAMRKSGSQDFWKLQYYLPLETRNHVKKFISTHYFFEGSGGITTLTKNETNELKTNLITEPTLSEKEKKETSVYMLRGFYNSDVICKKLNMSKDSFDKLNPGMNKVLAKGETYELRLPTEKMTVFLSKKPEILEACFHQLVS